MRDDSSNQVVVIIPTGKENFVQELFSKAQEFDGTKVNESNLNTGTRYTFEFENSEKSKLFHAFIPLEWIE